MSKQIYCETIVAKDGFKAEVYRVSNILGDTRYIAKHPRTKDTLFGGMQFVDIHEIKHAILQDV